MNAVDYTQKTPSTNRIMGNNGKYYPITEPLVTSRPRGHGWSVDVRVGDHNVHVEDSRPERVVARVLSLYAENDIELSEGQAWYNANLNWLSRATNKTMLASHKQLLALEITEQSVNMNGDDVFEEDWYLPDIWGPQAWRFMGVYLAQDGYNPDTFQLLLHFLEEMLEDERIGCPECLEHFEENTKEFKWLTQDDARNWMWETMNSIRKENGSSQITFAQAELIHRWR